MMTSERSTPRTSTWNIRIVSEVFVTSTVISACSPTFNSTCAGAMSSRSRSSPTFERGAPEAVSDPLMVPPRVPRADHSPHPR